MRISCDRIKIFYMVKARFFGKSGSSIKKYSYFCVPLYACPIAATLATPVLCNGSNVFKVTTSNGNVEIAATSDMIWLHIWKTVYPGFCVVSAQ